MASNVTLHRNSDGIIIAEIEGTEYVVHEENGRWYVDGIDAGASLADALFEIGPMGSL